MHSALDLASAQVASIVALRATPFAACVLASRLSSLGAKVVTLTSLAALVAAGSAFGWPLGLPLLVGLGSLGYFGLLALGTHWLAQEMKPGSYSPVLLLAALAAVYVCVPAFAVPGALGFTVALIGWEMMLSSYSYVVEVGRLPARARSEDSRRECLFFILVNPTLVYVDRGVAIGAPSLRADGVLRSLGGCAALLLHFLAFSWLLTLPAFTVVPLNDVHDWESYLRFNAYYAIRFVAGYAVHSGLASLQIGLMRLIGYRVPERYDYPFLARSVPDFWRRWNRYVGGWARRYVFTPLTLKLRRSFRAVPMTAARVVGVVATFGTLGFAHDLTRFAQRGAAFPGTMLFLFHAVALIVTVGAAPWLLTASKRFVGGTRLAAVGSRLVLWHVLLFTLWFMIPTMSGGSMDAPIRELKGLVARWERSVTSAPRGG